MRALRGGSRRGSPGANRTLLDHEGIDDDVCVGPDPGERGGALFAQRDLRPFEGAARHADRVERIEIARRRDGERVFDPLLGRQQLADDSVGGAAHDSMSGWIRRSVTAICCWIGSASAIARPAVSR